MFDKSYSFSFIDSNLLNFHGIYITPDPSKEVNATTLSFNYVHELELRTFIHCNN